MWSSDTTHSWQFRTRFPIRLRRRCSLNTITVSVLIKAGHSSLKTPITLPVYILQNAAPSGVAHVRAVRSRGSTQARSGHRTSYNWPWRTWNARRHATGALSRRDGRVQTTIPEGRRRSLADIAVAARSAVVGRAGRCPRSDCRLLRMAENSVAAEALYRRGARCIHHGPNQETGEQLP